MVQLADWDTAANLVELGDRRGEAAIKCASDGPHEIPEKWLLPRRGDLGSLPGAERMSHKRRVERFIVEIPHREHRCLRPVHLQHRLVAERSPAMARYPADSN